MAWLNVTNDLPVDVKVGQILRFEYEGSPIVLKIMRKDKKIWAKHLDPNKYLTPEEADERVTVVPEGTPKATPKL